MRLIQIVVTLGAAGVMAAAAAGLADAQARDFSAQAKFEPSGTASISGTIVTDDEPPRLLRRVVVRLTEAASTIQPRVVTSDEQGRYAFRDLPAGRYSVSASRQPYLTGMHGARRVAGPGAVQTGTVIVVASGQDVRDITIKMHRGAVITGTVRDVTGEPARNFRVQAHYYQRAAAPGGRRLVSQADVVTDDRGEYRLYGLPPGGYLISAAGGSGGGVLTSDMEIDRATQLADRASVVSAAVAPGSPAPPPPRRPEVGYAPLYYPGTADATNALVVSVGVAESRAGIDIQLAFVPFGSVEGKLVGPDGQPRAAHVVRVSGISSNAAGSPSTFGQYQTDPQGRFVLSQLAPGTYLIDGRPAQGSEAGYWAQAEVVVAGGDQHITLTLQPAMTLKGRITFEASTRKPPADLTRVRVSLTPVASGNTAGPTGTAQASGEFNLSGVVPGRYLLSAALPVPSIESGWYLKSATINGRETLDVPVDIRAGEQITDAVITMTDQPTELVGTMTDSTGSPAPEYFIVVFAEDEAHWQFDSRRIMQSRPLSDGSFAFRNLPPGPYRLAAVTDVQQNEWFDPDFLRQLVPASIRIALTEQGKVRQDLRVGK
jgi:protocatechuate 3,4-dioxygenase beta subunit